MERILEGLITYTEDPKKIIEFFIIYPPADPSLENNSSSPDLLSRIKDLEAQVTEKDSKLTNLLNQLKELDSSNSSLSFELEEKTIEISALRQSLQSCQSELGTVQQQLSSTTTQLDQKSLQCQKLQKAFNDLKNNRKTAEVLLEKQETMNKDLISKNVKFEKQAQDLEKRNQENLKIIQKLKDEIQGSNDLSKLRDEQIKSIIKKVKILEGEKIKLTEEVRKRDAAIKKVHEGNGEHVEVVVERPQNPPKEMKKVMEMLAVKDNEIKMMKDMIKSFQVKQHKVQSKEPAGKSVKLPPINSEKPVKKNERSIRFRDPSQTSLKNLSKVDSFVGSKNRKPGPIAGKQKFKTLFTENEDLPISPMGASVSKSPLLGANDDEVFEELKSSLGYAKVEKKGFPVVSKKLEKFIEVKDVRRKKLDFGGEDIDKDGERYGQGGFGGVLSENSPYKESVFEDEVRIETENNEKVELGDQGLSKGSEIEFGFGFGDRVQGVKNNRVGNSEEKNEFVGKFEEDNREFGRNSEKSVNREETWGNNEVNWENTEEKLENLSNKEENWEKNEDKTEKLINKEEEKEEILSYREEEGEGEEKFSNKEEVAEALSVKEENFNAYENINEYSGENFEDL